MRAAVMVAHGGPECLELCNVEPPRPGAGELRLDVRAAALNNTDIWTREGGYGTADDPDATAGWKGAPIDVPRIQGADVCGVVESVGGGVDRDWIGRRVVVDPARYDGVGPDSEPDDILGSERDGGFAEQCVVRTAEVHDVTDSPLDDAQVAALPIAYGTAMGMLARAGVDAGETLVVTGASGGVGLALVQLGRALGARVVAVSTDEHREVLTAEGATAVVDRRGEHLASRVRQAAARPVDVVADVVGGASFGSWPGVLARRGRIVVAGAVAGPIVSLDLRQLYLDQRRIIGSTMHTPTHFARLVELARAGDVRPVVARRFALEDIHGAQHALRDAATVGKVVLEMGAPGQSS